MLLYTVFAALAILSAVLTVVTTVAAWFLCARDRQQIWGTAPISVLKPMRGGDDELEQNLESFCRQTHPRFEIVVGTADPDDPALEIVRRVKARYPRVAIRIVSGQWPTGCNPKVRNLRNLLAVARYPNILVSDGDVRVDHDYLSVMAGAIERPRVGLVSNLIVGRGDRTLGSRCENAQINGFVATSTAAAMLIARHPIVVGKSMLFRRDALTNAGGFAAAADVLAEDYLLGRAVAQAGYDVLVLGYPVFAVSRERSLARMLQRQLRWAQIRRHVAPATFALEPLGYPIIWIALFCIVGSVSAPELRIGQVIAVVVGATVVASLALQTIALHRLRGRALSFKDFAVLPLVAALAILAWSRAWFDDAIVWRQQRFRIRKGSKLAPIGAELRRPPERLPKAA